MRHYARLIGFAACLLVLLTTCSLPFTGGRQVRVAAFVAPPTAVLGPTVLPTVTPVPMAASTPVLEPPAAPPLAAVLAPVRTGDGAPLAPDMLTRAAQMDAYIASLARQGRFSGSVLVAVRGHVLLSRGYGMANREAAIPATASTRYRLASVTKPLTALGVLRLAAAGKLNLDASICAYLDPCPAAWGPITVAHLLSHSSGLANYTDFAEFADLELSPSTPEQTIALFRDLPLGFVPGTLYHYTNSNYVVLGRLIEQVAGMSYEEFMRRELFQPLDMQDTGLDPGDFGPLKGTRGYAGGQPDIPLDVSNLFAAGDLYSSVEDLFKLAQALDAGRLLPADLAARMTTPGHGGYGLGWKIEQRGPHRLVYHPGSMSGAATWFGRYPDQGVTVIVLSNEYYANVSAIANYLAGQVLGS
ncbi:MAG: serine hydrolase domain-containing protein [Oscillochloridaceae bacterium]|nr:beta-lactamase family protein [Chloroflexaceae bacterium]MDW8390885.1 serine hydrolase domain-containing protein [Oscillochloridaceae bacterium]